MVTINDVRKLIESNGYIYLLSESSSLLKLNVNDALPPIQMFNIEADSVNKSGIGLEELENICSDDVNELINFVHVKISILKGDDIDYYNEDENDKDVVIEKLPFYKTFLIGYIIEYALLKIYPEKLEGYLKLLKVPKYKKYAAELRAIYNNM